MTLFIPSGRASLPESRQHRGVGPRWQTGETEPWASSITFSAWSELLRGKTWAGHSLHIHLQARHAPQLGIREVLLPDTVATSISPGRGSPFTENWPSSNGQKSRHGLQAIQPTHVKVTVPVSPWMSTSETGAMRLNSCFRRAPSKAKGRPPTNNVSSSSERLIAGVSGMGHAAAAPAAAAAAAAMPAVIAPPRGRSPPPPPMPSDGSTRLDGMRGAEKLMIGDDRLLLLASRSPLLVPVAPGFLDEDIALPSWGRRAPSLSFSEPDFLLLWLR